MDSRKQKELIAVRATSKFKKQLENIAENKGMTLPDLVRYILAKYIDDSNIE